MQRTQETVFFLFFTPYSQKGIELTLWKSSWSTDLICGHNFLKCFMTVIFCFTKRNLF